MKALISFFFLLTVQGSFAQVKFEQLNVKNKNAHIVYTGTVNTFSINLPKEISVKEITSSVGDVKPIDKHTFMLYVQQFTEAPVELKYTKIKNGVSIEEIYPVKFIVKQLPDYFRFRLGDYVESGKASLSKIQKNGAVALNDAGFNIDLKNIFIIFNVKRISSKGHTTELSNLYNNKKSDMLAFKRLILSLKRGDKLMFENIKAAMDNGNSRNMESLTLEII